MVDVTGKLPTVRTAVARSRIRLPEDVLQQLVDDGMHGPKGPVFHAAILAGTLAAKRTADLIPLCHPLPLEDCGIELEVEDSSHITVTCSCKTTHKTGVEMEALTGASVAALTVYDMCKGLSRKIAIVETALLEKTGGKEDYRHGSGADT
jgi:cyclic pyranopterin phosphate synthase